MRWRAAARVLRLGAGLAADLDGVVALGVLVDLVALDVFEGILGASCTRLLAKCLARWRSRGGVRCIACLGCRVCLGGVCGASSASLSPMMDPSSSSVESST